ncbi:hypothetical protein SBA3_2710007 [Candidatus Sulfopaludibacter sp. SbA3]|nr:hypothetical protein SBA3_2710007 [Candidatus Sulfopaludibacter sp. SbA3]
MESWFPGDAEKLKEYYGKGFREGVVSGNTAIEGIPKADVMRRLKTTTEATSKGPHHKTKHAPYALKLIRPGVVARASPHCARLFRAAERLAGNEVRRLGDPR